MGFLVVVKPTVSVIMSVFNSDEYLEDAIKSVLQQTYTDFEFIIINDGSNDNSLEIIKKFKMQDSRIVLISRENRGLIASLNEGLSVARGKYIARMDADDICFLTRFEKQVEFLKKNQKYSVVGSRAISIDEDGQFIRKIKSPSYNYMIKSLLFFGNPIIHPSVMINRDIIGDDLYYSSEYLHAEDYELWVRIGLNDNIRFYNIKEPLIFYRILQTSISRANKTSQSEMTAAISNKYLIKDNLVCNNQNRQEVFKGLLFKQIRKRYLIPQLLYLCKDILMKNLY